MKVTSIGYAKSGQADGIAGTKLAEELESYYASQEQADIKLVAYPDAGGADNNEAQLKKAVAANEIDGYLTFGPVQANGLPAVYYNLENLMSDSASSSLSGALQVINVNRVLQDAGISEEQKKLLFEPVKVETVQVPIGEGAGQGSERTPEQQGMAIGLTTVISLMLFMGIMITGQMIASEITAEKSSRVMELLITSVSPLKQMFGKIVGMCIVGLAQIVLYGLVILANLSMSHNRSAFQSLNIDLSAIDPSIIVYALLYYLCGYFLYATLYAAIGSTVSRTEDLGQAVMPITLVTLASFYIASFSVGTPDSTLVNVASYVPFSSPFVMMLRIGLTNPPVWQVLLSLAILIASILAAGWLSAKIYRTGVLMYGKRPSFKELRKAMKAFKA
ncbi:ABC transporter permease [Paenibacillus thailandensis]|uniref:ABC transporter permease n=1 Tax=Paenibacillus thailandensis TaxID=393250 RepID=UPI00362AA403